MTGDTAQGAYAANAGVLAARYEAISAPALLAPVLDLFPAAPARVADIGAGSGRDAAWLAGQGYAVTAVEPVAELRAQITQRHAGTGIALLDDQLPGLPALRALPRFDLLTLSAVWHHLPQEARPSAIRNLAASLAPGGLLVMSLRNGPIMPARGVFAADPVQAIRLAEGAGLTLLRRVTVDSQQDANRMAGIGWQWLALSQRI